MTQVLGTIRDDVRDQSRRDTRNVTTDDTGIIKPNKRTERVPGHQEEVTESGWDREGQPRLGTRGGIGGRSEIGMTYEESETPS